MSDLFDGSAANYPAAHSMDTTWFAVDETGAIAVFSTGEDGAVPHSHREDEGAEFLLYGPLSARAALLDVANGTRVLSPAIATEEPQLLLFKKEPRALPNATRIGLRRIVYHANRLTEAEAASLAAMEEFEGALPFDLDAAVDAVAEMVDADEGNRSYGLFTYNTEFGEEGRYTLTRAGTEPLLRSDELSEELSELVARFRFEGVSFADAPELHLGEHGGGIAWSYEIAADGTVTGKQDLAPADINIDRRVFIIGVVFAIVMILVIAWKT